MEIFDLNSEYEQIATLASNIDDNSENIIKYSKEIIEFCNQYQFDIHLVLRTNKMLSALDSIVKVYGLAEKFVKEEPLFTNRTSQLLSQVLKTKVEDQYGKIKAKAQMTRMFKYLAESTNNLGYEIQQLIKNYKEYVSKISQFLEQTNDLQASPERGDIGFVTKQLTTRYNKFKEIMQDPKEIGNALHDLVNTFYAKE